jgi:hypothetical protein
VLMRLMPSSGISALANRLRRNVAIVKISPVSLASDSNPQYDITLFQR